MLILHASDIHLGKTTHSRLNTTSRTDDFAASLMRLVKAAVDNGVQGIFISGDIFDGRHPRPRELDAYASFVAACKEAGIPVFEQEGNHDGQDIVANVDSHTHQFWRSLDMGGLNVYLEPTITRGFLANGDPFGLVVLPFPHKRVFDLDRPDLEQDERTELISVKVEEAIVAMGEKAHQQFDPEGLPIIFMGHLTIVAAKLGSERVMRQGWDVSVRSSVLDTFDYAALGHIHRQQRISDKAWYAGTPEYMDFGEEGQDKGFLLVEVEAGKNPVVTRIDSNPRPMMTIEMTEDDDGWHPSRTDSVEEAIVRLVLHPQKSVAAREELRLKAIYREAGASSVTVKTIPAEVEDAERPQVDATMSLSGALTKWLEARGLPNEPYLSMALDIQAAVEARA